MALFVLPGCNTGDALLGTIEQVEAGAMDAEELDAASEPGPDDAATFLDVIPVIEFNPSKPCGPSPLPACTYLSAESQWPLQLSASDLGDGIEFTALALQVGNVAVAARSAADGPFVVTTILNPPGGQPVWSRFEFSPKVLSRVIVDLVVGRDGDGHTTITVLGCEGQTCGLHAATFDNVVEIGDGLLTEVQGSQLPADLEIRGLALRGGNGAPFQVCVYGDGLSCFGSGGWQQLQPSGQTGVIEQAHSFGQEKMIAACADGKVRTLGGSDEEIISVVGEPHLISAHAAGSWAAGGLGGEVLTAIPVGDTRACLFGTDPIIGTGTNGTRVAYVSSVGRYLVGSVADGWCEGPAAPAAPIDVVSDECGISLNTLAMTQGQLWGRLDCAMGY
ncbi:MAG: hypothetical protein HY898_01660 [Deltaproteobacteria bacterium]|nr:hypothetical protein [Deltaproteobacteria bacterium]